MQLNDFEPLIHWWHAHFYAYSWGKSFLVREVLFLCLCPIDRHHPNPPHTIHLCHRHTDNDNSSNSHCQSIHFVWKNSPNNADTLCLLYSPSPNYNCDCCPRPESLWVDSYKTKILLNVLASKHWSLKQRSKSVFLRLSSDTLKIAYNIGSGHFGSIVT